MAKGRHAITAAETTIARGGELDPLAPAARTTRGLPPDSPWDDRIRPPLHLAVNADDGHPGRSLEEPPAEEADQMAG